LFATVVFVILLAVTAPHTWVMHKMKNWLIFSSVYSF
jgi:hypothetical protein